MTIHGVTKVTVLKVIYNGTAINPVSKSEMCGFKAIGMIKRSDFGIGANFPAPMISDEIALVSDLELSKE